MITTTHSYGGVTATVYVMQKGEKIPRHQHTFAHTTSVAAGKSEVEIYGNLPANVLGGTFQMLPGDPLYELPANLDHEIRALTDGTMVVNLSIGENQAAWTHPDYVAPAGGGVVLHDGTVVDAE
jgi:quercetin dioxygenase-like cupin family protein